MTDEPRLGQGESVVIEISYLGSEVRGAFRMLGEARSPIWEHLTHSAISSGDDYQIGAAELTVSWPTALSLVREFGSARQQSDLRFRFRPEGEAKERIGDFLAQLSAVR